MKKLLAVLLTVLTLTALCAPALADAPGYGYYDDSYLYSAQPAIQGPDANGNWKGEVIAKQITLFSKPSGSSSSLRKLKNGTQFDILDVKNDFAYVSVPNEAGGSDLGYVMFDYVIENPIHIVLRSASGVYALAGPYAINKRVGTLENYQRFTVISETGNYYIVSFRDAVAFLPMTADYWVEENLIDTLNGKYVNAMVAYDKTEVYGYASTKYGKIDRFNAGTPVQVYYNTNGFSAIRYNNVLAFISTDKLLF